MYWVHVLYSESTQKIYIGFTSDLANRILSHNIHATKGWTIKYRPWKLIYSEEFHQKVEAIKREKQLKSYQGRAFIRNKETTIEGFKAVKFMREVRDQIRNDIKDMTFKEIMRYFEERRLKLTTK
jgi:putative endonuclease